MTRYWQALLIRLLAYGQQRLVNAITPCGATLQRWSQSSSTLTAFWWAPVPWIQLPDSTILLQVNLIWLFPFFNVFHFYMWYDCDKTAYTHHYFCSTQMFLLDTSNSPCLACIVLLSSNCYHHEDWSLSRCYILSLGKFFLIFQRIVQPYSSGSGVKEVMKIKALQSLEVLWTTELTAQHNILDDLNLQQHHVKNIRSSIQPIHSHYLIK